MADFFFHQIAPAGRRFLRFEASELQRRFGTLVPLLPRPRPLHFAERPHEPAWGFPILITSELERAQATLNEYLEAETAAELAARGGAACPAERVERAFAAYRRRLLAISENVATASLASDYPQIFWLFHGREVARFLTPLPARLLAAHPTLDHRGAAQAKYRVLQRYFDRVIPQLLDQALELAADYGEDDATFLPPLLIAMRENLLLFSEDAIDDQLRALDDYFTGYLGIDGDRFLRRLRALERWQLAHHQPGPALAGLLPQVRPERRLYEPGFATYLAALPDYQPDHLLSPREVRLWEGLLRRLQEFDLFDLLRSRLVGVRAGDDGNLRCDAVDGERIGVGPRAVLTGSRGIDFMTAWVVDPEVTRGGLIYDIVDFTATLTRLGYFERQRQDDAFRALFRFQRRLDRVGRDQKLRFEKYLGDGAFYSSRDVANLLRAAIDVQRTYRQAVDRGFAFASGLRIGLGFGDYRLMAFGSRGGQERYEVFGQGIVELSRLVSGKAGAPAAASPVGVPLARWRRAPARAAARPAKGGGAAARQADAFSSWIDGEGGLHNLGIVATARFVQQLAQRGGFELQRCRGGFAGALVVRLPGSPHHHRTPRDLGAPNQYLLGVRRLGTPALKGLEELVVYEVVDASGWRYEADTLAPSELIAALDAVPMSELPI